MDDLLKLETRRKLYDILKKNPGLHLSKIADILHLRVSLVEYHLHYLEKHNLIKTDKETGYNRYFISNEFEPAHKKNFLILRQKNPLKIVLILFSKGHANHKELLKEMEISPATLSYHLKRLIKYNIVKVDLIGTIHDYYIINPEELKAWLIKYKPFNVIDGLTDIWTNFSL